MKDEYIERISEYEARAETARLLAAQWKRDLEEARKIIEDAPRLIAMFEAQEREAISKMRAYAKEMGYA